MEQSTAPPNVSTFAKFMIALVVVLAILFAFPIYQTVQHVNSAAKRANTTALMMACRTASQFFYTNVNRWPIALPELITNTNGIVYLAGNPGFVDSWGRPLIYVAPAGTNVAGSITSLGADGLPGGTNDAADISLTIP